MDCKECNRCKETKPLDQFDKNKRVPDGHQRYCKVCRKGITDEHYRNRGDYIRGREKSKREKNTDLYREWKQTLTCCMCGEDEPSCIDLHHVDPAEKDRAVSEFQKMSFKAVLREAKKCIPVCRNCHAKIHAELICVLPVSDFHKS